MSLFAFRRFRTDLKCWTASQRVTAAVGHRWLLSPVDASTNPFASLASKVDTKTNPQSQRTKRVINSVRGEGVATTEVYIQSSGHVVKRNWASNDGQWCALCAEPIPSWQSHHGRYDHSLLDSHYNGNVEYPHRVWDPVEVFRSVLCSPSLATSKDQRKQGALSHSNSAHQTRQHGGVAKRNSKNSTPSRRPETVPIGLHSNPFVGESEMMHCFLKQFASSDLHRRKEIFATIGFLQKHSLLQLNRSQISAVNAKLGGSVSAQAALLQHKWLITPMIKLFPDADVGLITRMMGFVQCDYNLETVYDVCGLAYYDDLFNNRNHRVGGGPFKNPEFDDEICSYRSRSVASSGSNFGDDANCTSSVSHGSNVSEETKSASTLSVTAKGTFMRLILGQLRWCFEESSVVEGVGQDVPPYLAGLGKYLAECILAESFVCRSCEYIVRSEPGWRQFGCEHRSIKDSEHPSHDSFFGGENTASIPHQDPPVLVCSGRRKSSQLGGDIDNSTGSRVRSLRDVRVAFQLAPPFKTCSYKPIPIDGSAHYESLYKY